MNSKTWMVVSLIITCAVAAFALAEIYAVTKPKIVQQQVDATNSALGQVLPSAKTFNNVIPDSLWYGLDSAGTKVGIVFRSGERGYGGPVPVLVGLDLTGHVVGLRVASAAEGLKETPGLGLKSLEPWFGRQFVGADSTVNLKKYGGQLDAISGATITSNAVTKGVTEGIRKYASHLTP